MIQFEVIGEPRPRQSVRSRVVARPGGKPFAMHYQPGNSPAAQWVAHIRATVAQVVQAPLTGPLCMTLIFYLHRPKSRPKRELWPDRKPDLDNLTKPFLDALQGVVFGNDSQIVRMVVEKHYSDRPRAEVKIGNEGIVDMALSREGK